MAGVRVFTTAEATAAELTEIHVLLDQAFEGAFSDDDWDHTLGGWHVVVVDGDAVVAHAAVVGRVIEVDDRPLAAGYVEGVATAPPRQRQGLGTVAMAEASALLRGNFEMGALSTDAHGFFEPLGWERWRGPTSVRRGSDRLRTEDEDAGIMVLRFGPSRNLDLHAPLTCQGRAGDDW